MGMPDEERLRRLAARFERQLTDHLGAQCTNQLADPSPPLTARVLQDMMAKLPKPETWLSTRWCPPGSAMVVEGGEEKFTVAHPSFWDRVRHELRREMEANPAPLGSPPLMRFNEEPIEIDPWEGDNEEMAAWRAAHWDRLVEAIRVALVPLPEWLRSPPKFREDRG